MYVKLNICTGIGARLSIRSCFLIDITPPSPDQNLAIPHLFSTSSRLLLGDRSRHSNQASCSPIKPYTLQLSAPVLFFRSLHSNRADGSSGRGGGLTLQGSGQLLKREVLGRAPDDPASSGQPAYTGYRHAVAVLTDQVSSGQFVS